VAASADGAGMHAALGRQCGPRPRIQEGHSGRSCHRPGRSGSPPFIAPRVVAAVGPFQRVPPRRFCRLPSHSVPLVVHPWLSAQAQPRSWDECEPPPASYPDGRALGGWRGVIWPQ